jgi:peptidoglycan/xylan/chitin deacetylase (PgdA/CDA1 family)
MFLTLMYHLVDERIVDPMSVSEGAFRSQMAVLRDMHIRLLGLADVDHILDRAIVPARGVLVTLDDGYRNTVDTALPILDECDVPAVVSLCASYVRPETRPAKTVHISQDFAGVSDLKLWLASGRDIAGHTYSHPKLTELTEEQVVAEVAEDKLILEELFSRALTTFFYPFGAVDKNVERIVGRYYKNAFADGRGSWPTPARRLCMRRLRVRPEWSSEDFLKQVERSLAECDA